MVISRLEDGVPHILVIFEALISLRSLIEQYINVLVKQS